VQKLKSFSVTNFLMAALENQKQIMVELSTDRVIFGAVVFTDLQGPWPSFQISRGQSDPPVICFLSQTVSLQWETTD